MTREKAIPNEGDTGTHVSGGIGEGPAKVAQSHDESYGRVLSEDGLETISPAAFDVNVQ